MQMPFSGKQQNIMPSKTITWSQITKGGHY